MGNSLVERIRALRRIRDRRRRNPGQLDITTGSDCGSPIGARERAEEAAQVAKMGLIRFAIDEQTI